MSTHDNGAGERVAADDFEFEAARRGHRFVRVDAATARREAEQPVQVLADERAAFERWAKEYGRIFLDRAEDGGYEFPFTQEAWVGWQARARSALAAAPQPTEAAPAIDTLVARFLAWPLPDDVCSDDCATQAGYPHRTGTVLLTAEQAKQMLLHVLGRPA